MINDIHFKWNIVDDVRGEGVIKMMMVDDMGEGGVKNDQKSGDVICGQPLIWTQDPDGPSFAIEGQPKVSPML